MPRLIGTIWKEGLWGDDVWGPIWAAASAPVEIPPGAYVLSWGDTRTSMASGNTSTLAAFGRTSTTLET